MVLPLVPVTLIVLVPVAARELTVMVMIEVPLPVMDVGLKLTVTRLPLTVLLRLTGELKPPLTVLVIVPPPVLPRVTASDVGDAAIVKPEVGLVTVSITVVVSTVVPEVPLTVTG